MINSEKRDFIAIMKTTADLYDRKLPNARIAIYWVALKHWPITEVRLAINRHVQDAARGRFFPLPADISAQLPPQQSAWLTADEAWAACPKGESESVAMCAEIACALHLASDLIGAGDLVAARRAFIDHYNRLANEAKRNGAPPIWWPSFGHDKNGHHNAVTQVIERRNLALPANKQIPQKKLTSENAISLQKLTAKMKKQTGEYDDDNDHI